MQLKPGWMILEEALLAVLDPNLKSFDPAEVDRRIRILRDNLKLRLVEIIPPEQTKRIVDLVAQAGAIDLDVWPKEVYDFVVNHDEEAIERFIAQKNQTWEHHVCPCGCGAKVVIQFDHLERLRRIQTTRDAEITAFFTSFLEQILGGGSVEPATEDPNGATAA